MAARKSSASRSSKASFDVWHRRLGHIQPITVKKAAELVDGIEIDGSTTPNNGDQSHCEICRLSQAPRQISRRPWGRQFGRYGQIFYDIVVMPIAYNKMQYFTHFYVSGIRFHWVYPHQFKNDAVVAIRHFLAFATKVLKLPIIAVHADNEQAVREDVEKELKREGFIITHTIPQHAEMNGPGERSGGVITMKARKLRIEGKLPEALWPEMVMAAAWILNRTPTYLKDKSQWIVPWDEARALLDADGVKKSDLSGIRIYGSLTYFRLDRIPQRNKLRPLKSAF
jgi:hypothetical protein